MFFQKYPKYSVTFWPVLKKTALFCKICCVQFLAKCWKIRLLFIPTSGHTAYLLPLTNCSPLHWYLCSYPKAILYHRKSIWRSTWVIWKWKFSDHQRRGAFDQHVRLEHDLPSRQHRFQRARSKRAGRQLRSRPHYDPCDPGWVIGRHLLIVAV